MTFMNLGSSNNTGSTAPKLQAKKIDVNFDNDDFFNSFEPAKPAATTAAVPIQSRAKLQEVDDPFFMPAQPSSDKKSEQKTTSAPSWQPKIQGVNDNVTEEEAQQKLREMGNRKCISSEEIFGQRDHKSDEVLMKYSQLQGAKAISSDMFFDRPEKQADLAESTENYLMGRTSLGSNLLSLNIFRQHQL